MADKDTMEILKAQGMVQKEAEDFLTGIKRGVKDVKEGKVQPWSKVKKELELGGAMAKIEEVRRHPQCPHPEVKCSNREEQDGIEKNKCLLRNPYGCQLFEPKSEIPIEQTTACPATNAPKPDKTRLLVDEVAQLIRIHGKTTGAGVLGKMIVGLVAEEILKDADGFVVTYLKKLEGAFEGKMIEACGVVTLTAEDMFKLFVADLGLYLKKKYLGENQEYNVACGDA